MFGVGCDEIQKDSERKGEHRHRELYIITITITRRREACEIKISFVFDEATLFILFFSLLLFHAQFVSLRFVFYALMLSH